MGARAFFCCTPPPPPVAEELVVSGIKMDTADLVRAIERAERRIKAMEDEIDRTTRTARRAESAFDGLTGKAIKLAAAYGAFQAVQRAGNFLFETITEFETLQARLEAVTGSVTAAESAFHLITEFARSTPFEVANLTESFTRLNAVGLRPTEEMLKGIGNFAAAMGEDISTATSAILKAAQGNAEQLRERFFLPVTTEGNKLRITVKGVTHEIAKDFGSMVQFFANLGNTTFDGAMERRVQTLGGAMSNLKDSAALLALEIGNAGLTGEVTDLVRMLDRAIQDSDGFAKTLGESLAAGVHVGVEAIAIFVEHLDMIIAAFQTLAAVAVAQGIVRIGTSLVAASAAAGGLRVALLAAFGGPPGVILSLIAVVGALAYQLTKTGEAGKVMAADIEGAARRAIEQVSRLPLEMAKAQLEAERGAITALEARQSSLQGRLNRDAMQGGSANAQVDAAGFARPPGAGDPNTPRSPSAAAARMTEDDRRWAQEQVDILQRVIQEREAAAAAIGDYVKAAEAANTTSGPPSTDKTTELERMTRALREQILAMTQGEHAAERYRIATAKGSEEDRATAMALQEQVWQLEKVQGVTERLEERFKDAARAKAQLSAQLEEERILLTQGETALLAYQLAQQGVSEADRKALIAKQILNEQLRYQIEQQEEANQRLADLAEEQMGRVQNAVDMMAAGFHDAFMQIITETDSVGDAFAAMAARILEELARIAFAQAAIGIFTGLTGMGVYGGGGVTGFGDRSFGGFRAGGGPVDPSRAYVVGERGPELFVPSSAGEVIPNGRAVGGGTQVIHQTVQLNLNAIDGRSAAVFLQENQGEIGKLLVELSQSNSGFRAALVGG